MQAPVPVAPLSHTPCPAHARPGPLRGHCTEQLGRAHDGSHRHSFATLLPATHTRPHPSPQYPRAHSAHAAPPQCPAAADAVQLHAPDAASHAPWPLHLRPPASRGHSVPQSAPPHPRAHRQRTAAAATVQSPWPEHGGPAAGPGQRVPHAAAPGTVRHAAAQAQAPVALWQRPWALQTGTAPPSQGTVQSGPTHPSSQRHSPVPKGPSRQAPWGPAGARGRARGAVRPRGAREARRRPLATGRAAVAPGAGAGAIGEAAPAAAADRAGGVRPAADGAVRPGPALGARAARAAGPVRVAPADGRPRGADGARPVPPAVRAPRVCGAREVAAVPGVAGRAAAGPGARRRDAPAAARPPARLAPPLRAAVRAVGADPAQRALPAPGAIPVPRPVVPEALADPEPHVRPRRARAVAGARAAPHEAGALQAALGAGEGGVAPTLPRAVAAVVACAVATADEARPRSPEHPDLAAAHARGAVVP